MKLSDVVAFITDPEAFTFTYKGDKLLKYLDEAGCIDEDSRFFVAGFEYGAHVLIHVESRREGYEAAWSAWIDSMPTIDDAELVEAYGPEGTPDGSFLDMAHAEARGDNPPYGTEAWDQAMARIRANARRMFDDYCKAAVDDSGPYPDIIEGYEQNGSGGVVDVGHYAWMEEADLADIDVTPKQTSDEKPET